MVALTGMAVTAAGRAALVQPLLSSESQSHKQGDDDDDDSGTSLGPFRSMSTLMLVKLIADGRDIAAMASRAKSGTGVSSSGSGGGASKDAATSVGVLIPFAQQILKSMDESS
jgi:hypothetical protein